ncbi:ABC transporter ATP-binding protein [Rhodoligotrophos defluvii]|uniref:ABC transporter ATP-binding protein n=1 Tax=Rhodoligotrophos defluvii TaxID=2561934 RepID=UPI0010CA0654|nr:ABC transporter ATP-binding protein [Rhodoligotrophos defluvii]
MSALLSVENLHAWYGKSHVLQGVSFAVGEHETVALLGRNGAGKTTTMRSIMGLLPQIEGSVRFAGEDVTAQPSFQLTRKGMSFVPETRGIFASLTVEENLRLAENAASPWTIDRVEEMFPALKPRRKTPGGKLSGGEQQMLAIARALLVGPRLLLLDEPTEGLAPVIVERVVALLQELKAEGLPILLVEQNINVCRAVADRHLIIDQGCLVWSGTSADLAASDEVIARHLTLEHA